VYVVATIRDAAENILQYSTKDEWQKDDKTAQKRARHYDEFFM